MKKFVRQTLVVARRDFMAIVFTPTFLVFLLAPLLMLGFGALGGVGAAHLAEGGEDRTRIVAIAGPAEATRLTAIDAQLRRLYRENEDPPELEIRAPAADPAAQARALFDADDIEVTAAMHGPLDRPTILHGPPSERHAAYLGALAEQALRNERAGATAPLSTATLAEVVRETATDSGREAAGFGAVFAIFLLTLLLAGQSVGMLAEERANKVIEILAAAVPLEAVFLGKLIGMFGVALLFVGFWGALLSQGMTLLPDDMAPLVALRPAVGLPMFIALFLAYFTLAFLLLGAVFLGVGAQASTIREIQMLSLPVTMFQVGMFAVSAAGSAKPGSLLATFTQIFPFSSPFAMASRAATDASLWPHLLALFWQFLWVALTVMVSARLFRRGVLKSGSGGGSALRWLGLGKSSAPATESL